jgi:hypothetical protein
VHGKSRPLAPDSLGVRGIVLYCRVVEGVLKGLDEIGELIGWDGGEDEEGCLGGEG